MNEDQLASSTVLVIEDNPAQLKTISDILENEGFQPICCPTGMEGIAACEHHDANVAIVDMRLPDINGLDILARLKQLKPEMRIIINTAYATVESAMTAVNRNAFAFVEKKGNVEELLRHVHRAFHTHFMAYSNLLEKEVQKRTVELKETNQTLMRKNRQLETLRQISMEITAELDIETLLSSIVSRSNDLFKGRSAGFLFYRPDQHVMEVAATAGKFVVLEHRLLSADNGFIGHIVKNRRVLVVDNYPEWEQRLPEYEHMEFVSLMGAPVSWGDNFIGLMAVESEETGFFSPEDGELLQLLATHAAIAVRNAQLFEQIRQDAQTKSTLLKEVNHRVGNNLTAIGGLLSLERRHLQQKDMGIYREIMDDLSNRVNSLAKVHGMLSASEWGPLNLGTLAERVIRSSLQILPPEKRVAVRVVQSKVRITPKQAHHLALIINELTTNTVKYALKDRDTGNIEIRIAKENSMMRFEFQDDGPGYPDDVIAMKRYNVGISLIRQLVPRDLAGTLSLENQDGALTIIEIPALIIV